MIWIITGCIAQTGRLIQHSIDVLQISGVVDIHYKIFDTFVLENFKRLIFVENDYVGNHNFCRLSFHNGLI